MNVLLLVLALWFQQPAPYSRTLDDVRDQVMINTNRLDSIERQIYIIQEGINPSVVRLSVIDSQQANLIAKVDALQSTLYSLLVFIFIQTFGLAVFGVKFYLRGGPHPMNWDEHKHDHSRDDDNG